MQRYNNQRWMLYGSAQKMRLMDLVPPKTTYSAKTLADDPKEAKLTREELEAQMAVFYKSGGKVQVIEPDTRAKKEEGKYTGVTQMPDGRFRITLNGFFGWGWLLRDTRKSNSYATQVSIQGW